jgi:hypothetical protein
MFDVDNVHGGSAYGAGTIAGPTGAKQPTEHDLGYAKHQVRGSGQWSCDQEPPRLRCCAGTSRARARARGGEHAPCVQGWEQGTLRRRAAE